MPEKPEGRSAASSHEASGISGARLAETQSAPELERLGDLIGRWMTLGETVATPDAPSVSIAASDVYEWVPGGQFVMHTAYARHGNVGGGGIEIIGFDSSTRQFRTWFFDSQGNVLTQKLTNEGDAWHWLGERVRCTGSLADGRKTIIAHHERSDDGVLWVPSMTVTMSRVD